MSRLPIRLRRKSNRDRSSPVPVRAFPSPVRRDLEQRHHERRRQIDHALTLAGLWGFERRAGGSRFFEGLADSQSPALEPSVAQRAPAHVQSHGSKSKMSGWPSHGATDGTRGLTGSESASTMNGLKVRSAFIAGRNSPIDREPRGSSFHTACGVPGGMTIRSPCCRI
jgi:hypothetical protein